MLVTLQNKNKMHKINLPNTVVGNYWLCDKTGKSDKKLVNIESINGNWTIKSNNNVKIIDLKSIDIRSNGLKAINSVQKVEPSIELEEYSTYGIYITNSKEFFILCCLPSYDDNFIRYDITHTHEIRIGSGRENHISYQNRLISNDHARIVLNNGKLIIENYDKNFGTFVNSKSIGNESRILFNGDVISIIGLKMIVMGNSIFINNPKNDVILDKNVLIPSKTVKEIPMLEDLGEENKEVELYSDKDYYSRAPRITNIIENQKVKIDAPPQLQDRQETPMILLLGSTLSMGAMMMVSMINTIDSGKNGQTDTKQMMFSLITTIIMLIGIMVLPIINVRYEKKQKVKYEKKRQERYKEYLNSKSSEINQIKNKQRSILYKNYVPADECTKIILNRDKRLWERKIEDYDFLSVRLGIGDVPLKIEVQYPEKQFAMEDDNLVDILNEIGENSKTLNKAPIVASFAEKNIAAFVKQDEENFEKFMQNIMVQLVTFHSYQDLKMVFLLDEDKQKKWEYVKMLPHLWNNSRDIRFFADNYDDMREISEYLEEILKERIQNLEDDKVYAPYYLIITDDYKKIENLKIIKEILKYNKVNLGFSLLCITEDINQLPNECKIFINIDNKKGVVFENKISSTNYRNIDLDVANQFFFGKIWQAIANIPIRNTTTGKAALPTGYSFLEMFDVGLIEQLNTLDRWKRNDSTISLKAPVGIDENKMPIVLDVHEKFHGPHGIVAGSTGSGKSEFLITYILSLAINYHPDDVSFLLIDYKGGGLAGAFQKNNIKLPHLVGTITNIDTNGLQRSLASIYSEVKRRQIMFNEARNRIDEGTIDIYKYQKLYHDGIIDEPIPHLIIICDEFAELKQQQEDFMDELISISRIGRSLGVHLILATQKPAGIINDQIRSNSKFAICLKVQDIEDSMDVIKKPDAASLKNAGQFYMQVGNDDYYILGQSAWAGAPYFPADLTKKKIDNSVDFISNVGTTIKKLDDSNQQILNNEGEQLTNIVKYICNLAKQENIVTKNLWLENIPETIYVDSLKKKYHIKSNVDSLKALIGEYDDPYSQHQGAVQIDLLNDGNVIIFGNAESGKETLLSAMVYSLITSYSSDQVQMYLLDFGSETLKIFKNCPHVGDTICAGEDEKIRRFFDMIQEIIAQRKIILSDYNGDYKLYLKTSGKTLPMIVIVINNYESFNEFYEEKYDDLMLTLTREGIKYGITFVTTSNSSNDLRYRLSQNFKKKITLQLNKDDDYYGVFENVGKKRPASIFGRGLIEIKGNIFEFQTAKICDATEYNSFINNTIEHLKDQNLLNAEHIPILPDRVRIDDVKKSIKNIESVPLGIIKKSLKVLTYNFKKNFVSILTGKKIENCIDYCFYILEVVKKIKNTNIIIINAENSSKNDKNNFIIPFNELAYGIDNNKNTDIHNLCVLIGLDKFLSNIEEEKFRETLEKAEQKGNYSFIIVDSATKLKDHTYDDWYKEYIAEDSGIWVGKGLDSQYLINISEDRREIDDNCGRDFGYVIRDGNFDSIKLLGMKKEGDDEDE